MSAHAYSEGLDVISRRDLLKMLATMGVGTSALSGYAVAESFREKVDPVSIVAAGLDAGTEPAAGGARRSPRLRAVDVD